MTDLLADVLLAEEFLDVRERQWEPGVRGASLVAEVDVEDGQTTQIGEMLGSYFRHAAGTSRAAQMFTRWPACVVLAMTGIAARDYAQGTFWPAFWSATGCTDSPANRDAWGSGFQRALRRLGLDAFPGLSLRHVGPVLMHTGIPVYCFGDLLRLLAERTRVDPELDADTFLIWATEQPSRMATLDKPVRRFLTHGVDYANDFVNRCLQLLDSLAAPEPDVSQILLPARLISQAVTLAGDGELTVRRRTVYAGSRPRLQRPRIELDTSGGTVDIILPAVGDTTDGTATWQIVADDRVPVIRRSRSSWAGVSEAAPATSFALSQPTRTVVVSLLGSPQQTELQLINPKAPLLTFTRDGRHIPASAALPPDLVWVLCPADRTVSTDKPAPAVAEGQVPAGWAGWRNTLLSLSEVTWLQLDDNAGSRRTVRGFTRPRIEVGDPCPGVTTPYGSRVFPTLPQVWLPDRAGVETQWHVTVRAAADRAVVFQQSVRASEAAIVSNLWESVSRPVLGAFSITAAGPLGHGIENTVFIAEALTVGHQPSVRTLCQDGLVPAITTVTGPVGGTAEPGYLRFAAEETTRVIEYRTSTETEPLLIKPPHLRTWYGSGNDTAQWRVKPLRLVTEDVRQEPGVLHVQLPPDTATPVTRLVANGAVVQEINGKVVANVLRLPLGQLTDTVADHPYADLVVMVGGTAMPVAVLRPRRLAGAVAVEGDRLVLRDAAPVAHMVASLYLTRAPWREPYVAPVIDGQVSLPSDCQNVGPMLVNLSVEDNGWVVPERPRWPERYIVASGDGHLHQGDAEEVALSRYLAGEGPLPTTVRHPRRVWTMLDLASAITPAGRREILRSECASLLSHEPLSALQGLTDLALGADRTLVALIAGGFVARRICGASRDLARRLWSVLPAAAVTLTDALDDDAVRDAAQMTCGSAAMQILDQGNDPAAGIGTFGQDALLLSAMESHQLEGVWSAARVVPQALLDIDSRAAAARQMFDARHILRDNAPDARAHLRLARELTAKSAFPALAEQIAARIPATEYGRWQLWPALSSAYAVTARLAARGDLYCMAFEQQIRSSFARLAAAAPKLVAIDLIAAEMRILGHRRDR